MFDVTPYLNIKEWQILANTIGAEYIPSSLGQSPKIIYTKENITFTFDKYKKGGGKSIFTYTRLSTEIICNKKLDLKISDSAGYAIQSIFQSSSITNYINGYKVKCSNYEFKNLILSNELFSTFFSNRNEMIFLMKTEPTKENEAYKLKLELNRLGDWKDIDELSQWLAWMSNFIEQPLINELQISCAHNK